jgi:hypothetical protein
MMVVLLHERLLRFGPPGGTVGLIEHPTNRVSEEGPSEQQSRYIGSWARAFLNPAITPACVASWSFTGSRMRVKLPYHWNTREFKSRGAM